MADELTTSPDFERAAAAANAAASQESFDFLGTVLDRTYPEVDVPVYLDERKIQRMLEIEKERGDLELRIAKAQEPSLEQAHALEKVDAEYQEVVDSLKSQRYLVRIKGISPERTIELEEKAYEEYPKEFEESKNPVTGVVTRTELPSEKREAYFAALLRQAHLVSVTAPNGATDNQWDDLSKVKTMWSNLPLVARAKVDQAINEATIAVDFYRSLVDEVF